MERENTCCFTGHRAERLPWRDDESAPACLDLKARLEGAVLAAYEAGFRHFLCGMATGADIYCGEAVAALRDARPDITLEAAIPFDGQDKTWPDAWRRRYQRLAERCDTVTVLHTMYTPDCMMDRNRYMVDRSSLVIAIYDGHTRGGTQNTMLYALRQGVEIVELAP
ncbi:MAG: DUF1273 domain-containing protein [Oscillospiraceae bacterium]|nr:DUF1273 domain-containing protein [Oscillospiraceae bacterium]MCD7748693.1 DUF1273 domain-containing protein [Oscillospiraceae bacterium]